MKYRDYLILPVIIMYVVFASCAFLAKNTPAASDVMAEPTASINPEEISWGGGDSGEYWYAEGTRNGECFTVDTGSGSKDIYFLDSTGSGTEPANYTVKNMHMHCRTDEGRSYDLIFVDELTAYDCVSGTYYQRADYDSLVDALTAGKFVNTTNSRDYYVFKDNGKSAEYFGDQVFKGRWNLETSHTLTVYDNQCRENFHFNLIFSDFGDLTGFTFNGIVYSLAV